MRREGGEAIVTKQLDRATLDFVLAEIQRRERVALDRGLMTRAAEDDAIAAWILSYYPAGRWRVNDTTPSHAAAPDSPRTEAATATPPASGTRPG